MPVPIYLIRRRHARLTREIWVAGDGACTVLVARRPPHVPGSRLCPAPRDHAVPRRATARSHVTVSTVGASPARVRQLADEAPTVRLALSLHAAKQGLRASLMPAARATPLDELVGALDYHASATGAGLMVEYLLIAGVNDTPSDADALAAFCNDRAAAGGSGYCNLIPYNPTVAGDAFGYLSPTDDAVRAFHARLRDSHGISALVRWSSATGRDVAGACGQLVCGDARNRKVERKVRADAAAAAGRA